MDTLCTAHAILRSVCTYFPLYSLIPSQQSSAVTLDSPDSAVAGGNNLHQGRHIRVALREVHIKHKATPAVRSVLGARDNGTDKVHVVLVLLEDATHNRPVPVISQAHSTCSHMCVHTHMHTTHTHTHTHTYICTTMYSCTCAQTHMPIVSAHLSDEDGRVKVDLQQALQLVQL